MLLRTLVAGSIFCQAAGVQTSKVATPLLRGQPEQLEPQQQHEQLLQPQLPREEERQPLILQGSVPGWGEAAMAALVSVGEHTKAAGAAQPRGERRRHAERPAARRSGEPYDWLFGVSTQNCDSAVLDGSPDSNFSRIFMPLFFVACTIALVNLRMPPGASEEAPRAEGAAAEAGAGTGGGAAGAAGAAIAAGTPGAVWAQKSAGTADAAQGRASSRLWHVDFGRIVAVMCVVYEHGGGEAYTHRNVGFGLWWALPYLYMSSGMGCMLSRSPMGVYVWRLLCILAAGVGLNWAADAITGRDWRGDFANTVFQMWFVVMLIVMAVLVEPLRLLLHQRHQSQAEAEGADAEPSQQKAGSVLVASAGMWLFATLVGFFFFLKAVPPESVPATEPVSGSEWATHYQPLVHNLPVATVEVAGTLFLASLACLVVAAQRQCAGLVGWVLLAYIYLPQVLVPWDMEGFGHMVTLYIFAMTIFVFPLAGTGTVVKMTRAYWPLLFMLLCSLSMPDMWGRCDVHPPGTYWERFRFFGGECLLTLCFVTGAFSPADPYDISRWLGWWALLAYISHVALVRVLGVPYGAVVTFSTIPLFYILHKLVVPGGSGASKVQKPS